MACEDRNVDRSASVPERPGEVATIGDSNSSGAIPGASQVDARAAPTSHGCLISAGR